MDESIAVVQKLQVSQLDSRAQELCESWGGCPGLPIPNSPYDLCWCKATFEEAGLMHAGGVETPCHTWTNAHQWCKNQQSQLD